MNSAPAAKSGPGPVILYDGECGLCDRLVQAVLRRDHSGVFRFAALQSPWAQAVLVRHGLSTVDFDTMVLVEGDVIHLRSDAALHVLRRLPAWGWTRILLALPRRLRHAVYQAIARRRKRWFPAPTACAVLKPEWRGRFIETA